jgi:hypothetical protein
MYRDRDMDLGRDLPASAEALTQDLELDTLFNAMARGDEYLRELANRCLLSGLTEPEAILYRQRVLADCLEHPAIVRQVYERAVEALESKKKAQVFWFRDSSPDALLQQSVRMLELLADVLKRLRELVDEHAPAFRSDGFTRLFASLQQELDDAYLQTVEQHLRELRFRRGALISAELGRGNRGTRYVLRKPRERTLLQRITPGKPASYSFTPPPATSTASRLSPSCETRASTSSPPRSHSRPITSSTSSARCGPSSASTSPASTCTSSSSRRGSRPVSPSPSQRVGLPFRRRGSTTSRSPFTSSPTSSATPSTLTARRSW